MNLNALRDSFLSKDVEEIKVEVNQRHLIDKILARYSSDFTVFRELIQNSNDAGAKAVEIYFHTATGSSGGARHSDKTTYTSIVFRNNGRVFSKADWTRLRKIAEGNPNEDKIGFFGVGFYSLFSVCEEPFVFSGETGMAFMWKGDQLYAKTGDTSSMKSVVEGLPLVTTDPTDVWTSFFLHLRDPMEMPDLDDFSRFLVTSLLFTRDLQIIRLYDGEKLLFNIHKKPSERKEISIPKGVVVKTPNKNFKLNQVNLQQIQMDVDKKFDSAPKSTFTSLLKWANIDLTKEYQKPGTFSIFMRIAIGEYGVIVSKDFARRMERVTKKMPPSKVSVMLMYTNHEEYQSSYVNNPIFKDLIVFPEQGKVFIGFATHQTTGNTAHIATSVIPTVERESIDFVDHTLAMWNQELLCACGQLMRIMYEHEMEHLQETFSGLLESVTDDTEAKKYNQGGEDFTSLCDQTIHNYNCFHCKDSTPNALVGRIIQDIFYKVSSQAPKILSTHGVLPASQVRFPDHDTGKFMKTLPTIPFKILDSNADFMKRLESFGLIRRVNFDDVLGELGTRQFSHEEVVSALKWFMSIRSTLNARDVQRFLSSVKVKASFSGKMVSLSAIRYFSKPNVIPPALIVDDNTMPPDISAHFPKSQLIVCIPGIQELTILRWCQFVCQTPKFTDGEGMLPEEVLHVVCKNFNAIDDVQKTYVISFFGEMKSIPTKFGLKKPDHAYLPSVTMFDDLPVVKLQKHRIPDNFLVQIGVRAMPSLDVIFERINDLKWDHHALIKYLVSMRDKLAASDISKLKDAKLFPKYIPKSIENETAVPKPVDRPAVSESNASIHHSQEKYAARELYFPDDNLKDLDFPIIGWKGYLQPNSEIGSFFSTLGLQRYVPMNDLIDKAHQGPADKRMKLLNYFIEHYQYCYSRTYHPGKVRVPFLPLAGEEKKLSKPDGCFANEECAVLQFPVLHASLKPYAEMFGVRLHPDGDMLVERLLSAPLTMEFAQPIFSYLGRRHSEFSTRNFKRLAKINFVPIIPNSDMPHNIKYEKPENVFFARENSPFENIFYFVDFGAEGNSFLKSCGVKNEPSTIDLALKIINDPRQLHLSLGDDKYTAVLRQLAIDFNEIQRKDRRIISKLQEKACLLGYKRVKKDSPKPHASKSQEKNGPGDDSKDDNNDDDDDETLVESVLTQAYNIYLNDDAILQQIFEPIRAPADTVLEEFYEKLGSKWLSKSVKQSWSVSTLVEPSQVANDLKELICEREPLLLYDSKSMGKKVIPKAELSLQKIQVKEARSLDVIWEFHQETRQQSTTACISLSKKSQAGNVLYVTHAFDYFDVASALTRCIYAAPRLNDSLLFATLLSTSLPNLKAKGFPVDRLLKQLKRKEEEALLALQHQRALERDRASSSHQEAPRPAVGEAPVGGASGNTAQGSRASLQDKSTSEIAEAVATVFPDMDRDVLHDFIQNHRDLDLNDMLDRLSEQGYAPRAKETPLAPSPNPSDETSSGKGKRRSGGFRDFIRRKMGDRGTLGTGTGRTQTPETHQQSVAAAKDIKRSLDASIASCQANRNDHLATTFPTDPPPASLRDALSTYCGAHPEVDLTRFGTVNGVETYYDPKDVSLASLPTLHPHFACFSRVLRHVARVMDLPTHALHMYVDVKGSAIAFNANRSLFYNLRFFNQLHYRDGGHGFHQESILYWFLVTCHELAHNFVSDHNAQHEFYLSTFAEAYLPSLFASMP